MQYRFSRLSLFVIVMSTACAASSSKGDEAPDAFFATDANPTTFWDANPNGNCGDDVGPNCDTPDAGAPGESDAGPGGALVEVDLFFIGDCVTAACPPEAPYPVGCNVLFSPGDERGCVASQPTSSTVYFQAGDQCNAGIVAGSLYCSDTVGAPLDNTSCPINKPIPIHVAAPQDCPEITD